MKSLADDPLSIDFEATIGTRMKCEKSELPEDQCDSTRSNLHCSESDNSLEMTSTDTRLQPTVSSVGTSTALPVEPLTCPLCLRVYKSRGGLIKHERICGKKTICEKCHSEFPVLNFYIHRNHCGKKVDIKDLVEKNARKAAAYLNKLSDPETRR